MSGYKNQRLDCLKCKAKKTVLLFHKIEDDVVKVVIHKCSACNHVNQLEDYLKEFKHGT